MLRGGEGSLGSKQHFLILTYLKTYYLIILISCESFIKIDQIVPELYQFEVMYIQFNTTIRISSGFYENSDFFHFKSLNSLSFNRNMFKLDSLYLEHSTKGVTEPFFKIWFYIFQKLRPKLIKMTILRNFTIFLNFSNFKNF